MRTTRTKGASRTRSLTEGTHSHIPTGFRPPAQGCETRATLGIPSVFGPTPTGLRPPSGKQRSPCTAPANTTHPPAMNDSSPSAFNGRNAFPYPNGISPYSPRLRGTSYLGYSVNHSVQPHRCCAPPFRFHLPNPAEPDSSAHHTRLSHAGLMDCGGRGGDRE